MHNETWEIWADTGGTFTDALGISPRGEMGRAKVLSAGSLRARVARIDGPWVFLDHSWGQWASLPAAAAGWQLAVLGSDQREQILEWQDGLRAKLARMPAAIAVGSTVEIESGEEAPILAARLLTNTPARAPLPPIRLRLATTRGTNALLTGEYSPTVLVINRGLGDLLRIGTQQRPDLFALNIRKAPPIHAAVIEVDGRLDAAGTEIAPLDLSAISAAARETARCGIRDAAVCLLHADLNPGHEDAVANVLLDAGMASVTCSSRVAPFIKILPRATTSIVNACLSPVISTYLEGVRVALRAPGSSLLVMTSAGGLSPPGEFLPKDSLLSGPAAGVVGAAAAAEHSGFDHAVSIDMGGTSTDAAHWNRQTGIEYVFEHSVGAATLLAAAAAVETVAAGGGSICSFRDGALSVGPESAGASPGPACYGAGGPLTLTDVNLLLGRLRPERFAIPVDRNASEVAFASVAAALAHADSTGSGESGERLLQGFLEIAAERMAGAVRRTSTRRGHSLSGAAMVAFGGAGGQHACAIADRLGLSTVLVPCDAGLLSARGLGAAMVERFAQRQVLESVDAIATRLRVVLAELETDAVANAAQSAGVDTARIRRRIAAMRFMGQETALEIDLPSDVVVTCESLRAQFAARHMQVYGFAPQAEREVELVWLRAIAEASPPASSATVKTEVQQVPSHSASVTEQSAYFDGRWQATRVVERSSLSAANPLVGPSIIADDHCTIVVEPGWVATANAEGDVVMHRAHAVITAKPSAFVVADDPAALELFSARFESLASEMGEVLARTSVSVNVKERLDFSCALLSPAGELVACAPHVPVHLGSLGACVREVIAALPLAPGESAITNHPAHGGSHLPDVTVISPVHDAAGVGGLLGFVASRAHHAEIGGRTPGSMPPDARTLEEEGVVLAPFKIVQGGRSREDLLESKLRDATFPSRNIADNLADVRAALAANARGAAMLRQLAADHGPGTVSSLMESIQRRSEGLLRSRIQSLGNLDVRVHDAMDDGSPLRVRLRTSNDELTIDFTGSSGVHPGNLNATPAIVASCIVYVMRILLGHSVPLNEGLLRPVRITLPEGMLNPPFTKSDSSAALPAVVGGNVETSQRVVDVLLRGLGLCASSQGTMNNFVFGAIPGSASSSASYYETICGGAGAGPGFGGASAVHTHMTNTRITDPEVLERRYPVRLERFAIRSDSGGSGATGESGGRGGDGVERVIRFLAPLRVSLLTQRRTSGPPGLAGGHAGSPGEQSLLRADGTRTNLGAIDGFDARSGDVLTIRTPGGGGYGVPSSTKKAPG